MFPHDKDIFTVKPFIATTRLRENEMKMKNCPVCKGTGKRGDSIKKYDCGACHGTGKLKPQNSDCDCTGCSGKCKDKELKFIAAEDITEIDSVEETIEDRDKKYGGYAESADLIQTLKIFLTSRLGWTQLSRPQMQALEMILNKIGRIVSGDPNYIDSWHDIQGYAKLVEDILKEEQNERS